jgi:hypothetical protein
LRAMSLLCNVIPPNIKIKENSWQAKWAAKKMGASGVAMVLGGTIHLWGVSKEAFLTNKNWIKHELKHVEQYRRYGYLGFLARYLWFSYKYGYYNNPLEIEARAAEI